MTTPKRIQRKRTKGWRKPEGAVIVDRTSRYGNPYTVQPIGMTQWVVYEWDELVGDKTRSRPQALAECLYFYRKWAELQIAIDGPQWLDPLRGKDLVCFCPLDQPCHADILLELANKDATP